MSRSILLYGDVNAAYRDGSRIWLESMVDALTQTGSRVTLLLKAMPAEGAPPFGAGLDCTIIEPVAGHRSRGAGMTVGEAREQIVELDRAQHFDIVLTRGYAIANELSAAPELTGRLWPYITDGPGFDAFSDEGADDLARIAHSARRVLVQTEDARSVWEARTPAATGKTLLLPPMVPDECFAEELGEDGASAGRRGTSADPLRLVYSGKFARAWKSLEMPALPDGLAAKGVESHLTMIGDKIHHSPDDRPFPAEMRAVMAKERARVTWEGGLERVDALRVAARADVGLCWREASLDASLEISTKLLEFAALGVAPIVNRTRAHERLLGTDYPLFIDVDVLTTLTEACDPQTRREAARRAREAVEPHRSSRCAARLLQYFASTEPDLEQTPPLPSPRREGALRVLFSSHDFKFAGELIDVLEQRDDIELRIDTWNRLADHDAEASAADGDWADVIICEWAGHNAVFHSRRKRPDQRLIVRFHGFEIRGAWLRDIVVDAVDAFVFVSDFYRHEILMKTGWPESRTTVIPNVVDVTDLDRDKLPDAAFHLGLAGYVPMLKRPDRAVDLLERLLAEDDRFTLHLRGRAPWSYPWEWAKPLQRNAYEALLDRVRGSEQLRSRVIFEDFGPDMGSWFRGIGWVLSPSVRETFHLAPVEGMASGAVPIVWSRPGAVEVFGDALFDEMDAMAESILQTVRTPGEFDRRSRDAKERARAFDMSAHRRAWLDLLDPARSTPLPLRGTPMVDRVPDGGALEAPQVAATVERALADADAARAVAVMALPGARADEGSHLQGRLHDLRETALLLDGLRSGRWIPPRGLGPVYRPVRSTDPSAEPVLEARAVIEAVDLRATPVLAAADALVTAARRLRPTTLLAPGDAGGVVAAAIAARRLGIDLEVTQAGSAALATADRALPGLSAAVRAAMQRAAPPVDLADLTVGLIADAFTARAVSSAVRTVAIPRQDWRTVLDEAAVDVILVESAWSAPGQPWFHGIAYHGDEAAADLRGILQYARERGIPTLFWNREDPVHQRSFRIPAADFDAVLTSDAGCIPAYLSTLPSRTTVVASLPFFADPTAMFPAVAQQRDGEAAPTAYAGTYYGERYPQRTRELRSILSVASDFGLAVYDRQATLASSPYRLPDELMAFSRGGVPAEQMPDVYRRHPIHLNVNSVTDSPTMFSRRVVEIASSGSLVLSGAGDGVQSVLGSAFPVLVDEDAWRTNLSELLADGETWRAAVWAQLRTVRRSFTSDRSLALALRIAGLPVRAPREPHYAVLVPGSFRGAAELLLSQTLPPSAVAIAADHPDRDTLEAAGITLVPLDVAAKDLGSLIDEDGYVGVLAPDLTPTHYEDLLFAAASTGWERIVARDAPETEAEAFRIVAATAPSAGDVAGALYARTVAHDARDLASGDSRRTFVWIRDRAGAVDHVEGD